jgi:hypothetical protein
MKIQVIVFWRVIQCSGVVGYQLTLWRTLLTPASPEDHITVWCHNQGDTDLILPFDIYQQKLCIDTVH